MSFRTPAAGLILGLLFLLVGCELPSSGPSDGLVARAGDHTFTVDEAVALLEGQSRVPSNEEVVRAISDLWIDYTLLAEVAQRDSTLSSLDLDPLLEPQLEQELVLAFRDSVVSPDTSFTESELRRAYETQGSGVEVQARHILLSFPQNATEAQLDSIDALARELRERITEGEDFGELAREFSDDPGSASRGGDLGTFGRGEMAPAFEEAAFSLDSGEVSDPVETPYGLHLIQLQGRETPSFEENRDRFAEELRNRRVAQAESAYVAELEGSADVEVLEDAYPVVRELADRPGTSLSSRARRRALVRYQDGSLTADEVRTFLQGRSPQERGQVAQASEEQLDRILRNLTRRELLLNAAREEGFEVAETRRDSLRSQVRGQLQQAVAQVGLDDIPVEDGESESQAIDRAVQDLLTRTLAGRQQVLPLGNLSYTLRDEFEGEVFEAGVSQVVDRLSQDDTEGAPSGASGGPAPTDTAAAPSPPASGGDSTP